MNPYHSSRSCLLLFVACLLGPLPGVLGCDEYSQHDIQRVPELTIMAPGISLPATLRQKVTLATEQMYREWEVFLGGGRVNLVPVELLLLADLDEFEGLKVELAPDLPTVSGFYSIGTKQAVVRYDAREMEETRRTAIHELSHLVATAQIGPVSPWLAEGLAEYYETLELTSDGPLVHPNQRHKHLLEPESLPHLAEFLELNTASWQGEEGMRNYAVSWSLIYFLMSNSEGRETLSEVFVQLNANRCTPLPASYLLDGAYDGGLARLDTRWRAWLKNGVGGPQSP